MNTMNGLCQPLSLLLSPKWSIAAAFCAFACGFPKVAAAPPPLSAAEVGQAQAKWPDSGADSLSRGRETFVAKCNGCHGYPDLKTIPAERWPQIMESMGKKSDLDAARTKDVERFILVARERPATGG